MNKRYMLVFCVLLGGLLTYLLPTSNKSVVDFDTSMKITDKHFAPFFDSCMKSEGLKQFYIFVKKLYEAHHPTKIIVQDDPIVPKVTHIIWLGSQFPTKYHAYRKSWLDKHPGWTHIFWVDSEENYNFGVLIEPLDIKKFAEDVQAGVYKGKSLVVDAKRFPLFNQIYYDQSQNYGEKSDLLRWEIVYLFGGVYIDVDFECLKPLDTLNYSYEFYTALQPLDVDIVALGAALFGSVPRHPILKHCIATIKNDRDKKVVYMRTGPIHFTKSFWNVASTMMDKKIIAFPSSYFYPLGISELCTDFKAQAETYAVHWWAGSWQKAEGYVGSNRV